MKICAVVPSYENPQTVGAVVDRLRRHVPDVFVVDDGSGPTQQRVLDGLLDEGRARVVRRPQNGGKGAAVKTGLHAAREAGFSHALQVDADGQHDLDDVPRFLEAARARPEALVLGHPLFDASAPRSRLVGRKITSFWVRLETGGDIIADAMCGFRVYPIEAALAAGAHGDAMDFDPEIAVRMVWAGVPVVNVPTRVSYLAPGDGGVSHFRLFMDNVLISWMHTRLMFRKTILS